MSIDDATKKRKHGSDAERMALELSKINLIHNIQFKFSIDKDRIFFSDTACQSNQRQCTWRDEMAVPGYCAKVHLTFVTSLPYRRYLTRYSVWCPECYDSRLSAGPYVLCVLRRSTHRIDRGGWRENQRPSDHGTAHLSAGAGTERQPADRFCEFNRSVFGKGLHYKARAMVGKGQISDKNGSKAYPLRTGPARASPISFWALPTSNLPASVYDGNPQNHSC